MPSLDMKGSYDLTDSEIDRVVTKKSPGSYALGRVNDEDKFLVSRVGRSDSDVNARLHDHAGDYNKFRYSSASSAKAAFEKECDNYHDFDPPDNKAHPGRPDGTNWECPRCDHFDYPEPYEAG